MGSTSAGPHATTSAMKVTIAAAPEHPAPLWWSAAHLAAAIPAELEPLIAGKADAVEVPRDRARELRRWCAALPGWDPAHAPLRFRGLDGRPPSPRGMAGGVAVLVRVSKDEHDALSALASARRQSVADVLRRGGLLEVKREDASVIAQADPGIHADAIRPDMVQTGDQLYADAAHALSGGPGERVVTKRQEWGLWGIELASGAVRWLADGARAWRRRARS